MKQFFKFMFASCLGSALMLIVLMIALICMVGSGSKNSVSVKPKTILYMNLNYDIPERTTETDFTAALMGFRNSVADMSGMNDIIANIEEATDNLNSILADNKGKVSNLVTSLQKFGNTLEEASPKLNEILDNFDQISDTIAKADIAGVISNANSTIKEVQTPVAKANNGDGTVSALLNDEGLVKKIDDTIKSLNDLLKDFQDNPRHYLKPLGEKKKKSKK